MIRRCQQNCSRPELAASRLPGVKRALVLAVLARVAGVASAEPQRVLSAEPVRTAAAAPAQADPVEASAAEPVHVVSAGQRLSPRADVVLASLSTTHNDALTTQDLRLKAAAPLARGDGYGLALLLSYGATRLEVSSEGQDEHLTLHRFEAGVGGGAGLAPAWSLRGSFAVAHSSDLRDTTWDAVQVTSSAMLHHVVGPSDALVFGLVYTSNAQLFPVLPLLGYVHQREGSRFRLDVFLPHHVRAEYALRPRLRGAVGLEASGDTWTVQMSGTQRIASREGGAVFGELQVFAGGMIHVEGRAGLSVERYALPMQLDGALHDQPLRPAAFAQLAVIIAP